MAHLLLVEDESDIGEPFVELLTEFGYRVELIESAEAAIEVLEGTASDLPDAILTDIRLPGMSGIELMQTVRMNPTWQRIPFICFSASVPPETKDYLETRVDVKFIRKPFEADALLKMIAEVTSR